MFIPVFLCIGFMIAVLYMDLVFDISALPYRKTGSNLPKEILEAIATYYRYVTRNPSLLVFVLLTAAACILKELNMQRVPQWAGYLSAVLMATVMLLGMLKVIPTAQRLASGKDTEEKQTRLVHSLFPYHILLLILVLSLAMVQFRSIESVRSFGMP